MWKKKKWFLNLYISMSPTFFNNKHLLGSTGIETGNVFSEVLRAVIPNSSIESVICLYDLCFSDSSNFHSKTYSFHDISFKLKSERVAIFGPPPTFH